MPIVGNERDTVEVALTEREIEKIKSFLGRDPYITEWGMFDVMGSEHCSYKSSRPKLKLFEPAEENYDYVLAGPGQDAGVVDIGDDYCIAFRIESHNHPSAIEPYHGAATGIGGIIRDILCMGMRPIALLDPLRFGRLENNSHSQWLLKYVVKGIADYGNCTGIPTIGGEVEFDDSFENNCLVNVACIGVGKVEDLAPSRASKPGDYAVLMGNSTGRDGIHGVTFASRTLTQQSESDRPAVQIADPFSKKLIIEATVEAVKTGYVRGLKDLGGGGLSCASSELTGDGGTGIEFDVNKIFTREPNMTPFEIMLSESQERMMFIIKAEGLETILDIFKKYETPHAVLGRIDNSKLLRVKDADKIVVELDPTLLSDFPVIIREEKRPDFLNDLINQKTPERTLKFDEIIYQLIASENICSKEWIYRQYDHEVGVRSVVKCGDGDSGVLRIIGTNKYISASVGCNSKHCYLDPYEGAKGAVVEIGCNIVSNGLKPIAMVNCCNFGNPEKPTSFWYFSECVKGMADSIKFLNIPCVGGNVSFYNEDEVLQKVIKPTPIIMLLGYIEGQENIITLPFKKSGNPIFLIGETKNELGGSEYHSVIYNIEGGTPPKVNLDSAKRTWDFLLDANKKGFIKSAHDVNKGGFLITILEMSFPNELGADLNLYDCFDKDLTSEQILFSESVGRFIIEVDADKLKDLIVLIKKYKLYFKEIGVIIEEKQIKIKGLEENLNLDIIIAKNLFNSTLPRIMEGDM